MHFLAILQFIALHFNFTIKTHGQCPRRSATSLVFGQANMVIVSLRVCVCKFVMDIATFRMRVCYNFKHLTFVLVNERSELHVCPARGLAWLLIICKQQHCCCDCGSCCCCCSCCCGCVECLLLSELPMRAICILINVAATCNDCTNCTQAQIDNFFDISAACT